MTIEARGRRFLSLPKRKADWLRLALSALAAYVVTVEIVYLLGYEIRLPRHIPHEALFLYPLLLFVLGSIAAWFVERRSGAVFTAIWVVVIGVAVFTPMR